MASHVGSNIAARVSLIGLLTLALTVPLGGSGCAAEVGGDADEPRGDIILAISGGKTLSLEVGERVQLNAAIQSPTGSTVDLALFTLSWSSSDGSIVAVEPNGVITGVRAGTAVVTARAERVADAMVLTAGVDVAVSEPVAPTCGDGSCDGGETSASCPADCQPPGSVCGDGSCAQDESCSSCAADCGACSTPLAIVRGPSNGLVGVPYSSPAEAEGGKPPYAWDVAAGAPPPGLSLSPEGVLSGTPTKAGTFALTLRVRDALIPSAVATLEVTVAIAVASAAPHAYFEALTKRPDVDTFFSMRDAAQVAQYRRGASTTPIGADYLFPFDPDPRRQDACKVVIPPTHNSLRTQVRFPFNTRFGYLGTQSASGRRIENTGFLVTWDYWMGEEYHFNNHGIPTQKTFQISGEPGNRIWTEPRSRFSQAKLTPGISKVDVRYYGGLSGGYWGPGVTDNAPLSPYNETPNFLVMPETWTRRWVYFEKRAGDDPKWWRFWQWMADENTDPVMIHDGTAALTHYSMDEGWGAFWLEFNTSHSTVVPRAGPNGGELVAYVRNLVVLKGVSPSDVANLLQRPIGQ